jgi:hypothetical protein
MFCLALVLTLFEAPCCQLPATPSEIAGDILLLKRSIAVGDQAKTAALWQEVVRHGSSALPHLLSQLNDADTVAANWLRAAFETIAEKELKAKRPLPQEVLTAFLTETKNEPRARRMVYEWLCRVDPATPQKWIPKFLNDPSPELRREAVAIRLEELAKSDSKEDFWKLLYHARDKDQVDAIATRLAKLGATVDLAPHYGFIREWAVLGPFDNTDGKGFITAYPPQTELNLQSKSPGKDGVELTWKGFSSKESYGLIDLNKAIGKHSSAVGYAYAEFQQNGTERFAEIRCASQNALQVFLNGVMVFAHEEYHHGTRMDQFTIKVRLRPGKNVLLVKVCQNNMKESWAQSWGFQLRICDSVGGRLPNLVERPYVPPMKGIPFFHGP